MDGVGNTGGMGETRKIKEKALKALKQYYGYDAFRPGQERVVASILSGRDALAVMPTGAGKSVCYQIPAVLFPGITLVVSPLISLMKDQVQALNQSGIRAAYLNSSLTPGQFVAALRNARQGMYKIIYVAPERLLTERFLEFARQAEISLLAVDEAHCISQWGQDFRPSYLQIAPFLQALPKRPVAAAFTATATRQVQEDILRQLCLQDPCILTTGFDRPNLFFSVKRPGDKTAFVLDYAAKHPERAGIVYCGTRKNTDALVQALQEAGVKALPYHAGLPDEVRHRNQEDFLFDRCRVMVATNAFGMGIDKSNVSYVIHYNLPMNLENYYQEAGRAGRDGGPAECILLFSPGDLGLCRFLLEKNLELNPEYTPEQRETRRQQELEKLSRMSFYASCSGCLRREILKYFGEKAPLRCGNCGNCLGEDPAEQERWKKEARVVLSLIRKTGQRYGLRRIQSLLSGEIWEEGETLGLERLPEFGAFRGKSSMALRSLLEELLQQGYLVRTQEEFPRLRLGRSASKLLREKEQRPKASGEETQRFVRLKKKRDAWAARLGVPPYTIYSDQTLREMAERCPTTPEAFLDIPGSTPSKLERFGREFLELLRQECREEKEESL